MKSEDIEKLVSETRKIFGKIDILVNNAGGPPGGGFEQFSDEDWQKAFELNLLSYIRIIRAVQSLAEELAPYNILVNTVAPGRIATDRVAFLDQVKADKLGVSREQVEEQSKKTIPLGRNGTPEEFGKVVAFLVSGASTYVTGSSFLVDGGMVKSI